MTGKCEKSLLFVLAILAPPSLALTGVSGVGTSLKSFHLVRKEELASARDVNLESSTKSAYAHLLDDLAQCACLPDDAKSPPSLETQSLQRGTDRRSKRFPPTKQFLDAVYDLKLTFFLRDGTLLAVVRNQGWMPYDYDFDVGLAASTEEQATSDIQKLKEYLQAKDPQFTLKTYSANHFTVQHASVPEWPVADVVIFFAEGIKSGDDAWNDRKPSDQCEGLLNLPGKFFAAKFEDMTWAPFYSTNAPIPPNFHELLDGIYGKKWSCEADNKCNAPDGMLFKKDPSHCNMPLYVGAREYPLHTCGLSMQRGPLHITSKLMEQEDLSERERELLGMQKTSAAVLFQRLLSAGGPLAGDDQEQTPVGSVTGPLATPLQGPVGSVYGPLAQRWHHHGGPGHRGVHHFASRQGWK